MPFIPRYEGEVATLGWEIIEWMEENLAMPDQIEYIPFRLTKEQAQFILNWYSVDHLGRWRYVRGVYSRPKGPIAHTTLVNTPDGQVKHGDLVVGSRVYAVDGSITKVIELGDEVNDDCYKITFSDNTSVVSTGSHRWPVEEFNGGGRTSKILTVEQMIKKGLRYERKLTSGSTKATSAGVSRFKTLISPELEGKQERVVRERKHKNMFSRSRMIVSIEPVASEPARCITVAHREHQYLVGEANVPTCNSGKSPFTGAIGIAQALGPVEFCGWDENGRPVGGPPKRPPLIQFAAVNEDQTENAYGPLLEMIKLGPLMENYPGVDPMDSFVALPNGGKIVPITANALSKEGAKSKLVVMDQTESWFKSNGGHKLANVLRRNSAKVGGRTLELPNAPESGMGSVAELTAKYAADIAAGKLDDKSPLLFDHREAPADFDLYDLDELRKSLVYVYGDSAMDNGGWVDIDRIVIEFLDPMNSVEELRRFYLNQAAQSADAWLSPNEVKAIVAEDIPLQDGDKIVLGFDGSQGRVKGKADATALIAIRLRDMSMHEIKIWEAPDDMRLAQRWAIDAEDVHDKVLETFETYDVVGFYADPSGWTEWITKWDAKFGKKLKLKATPKSAISAWPSGKTSQVITWVERLRQAIASSEVRLEHKSRILKQHIINARRRNVRNGYLLYKSYPMSPDKVDGAYAAMLAYKAAIEARSKNLDVVVERKKQKMTIYR